MTDSQQTLSQTGHSGAFKRMSIDAATAKLIELHQLVLRNSGRIELATPDGGTTVLISKCELDALEAALTILGNTDGVRAMREELARVAVATTSGADNS
jgi:hypothetical protein